MSDSGIKPRFAVLIFACACASVVMSSALLLSLLFREPAVPSASGPSAVPRIEAAIKARDFDTAWRLFAEESRLAGRSWGPAEAALLHNLWQADPREQTLRTIVRERAAAGAPFDERVLLSYLVLEAGLGSAAPQLSSAGEFGKEFPALEAEVALWRDPASAVRGSAFAAAFAADDTRLSLVRAFAWGYLGDFDRARKEANRVIAASDPPGVSGSGLIDPARGLCRRQTARAIQIMTNWDEGGRTRDSLTREAALELMFDPRGLAVVAPAYYELVGDALARSGERATLLDWYTVADLSGHQPSAALRETRSLVAHDPALRPGTWEDLRSVLARPVAGDARSARPDLQEAAWNHDDERGYRLVAWDFWTAADYVGLNSLLDRARVRRGPWHDFYQGLEAEREDRLGYALELVRAADGPYLESASLANQARLHAREGQLARARALAEEASAVTVQRSLGLQERPGTPQAAWYADVLALRARIAERLGRAAEADGLYRTIERLDPGHPALFHARNLPIGPGSDTEPSRDTTQNH